MTIFRWAALALALLLAAPVAAIAQTTGSSVQFPAGYAPSISPCVKQVNGTCIPVSADNPLPIAGPGAGGGDASAANQTTQIAAEQAIRDRIGALTTPAAGSTNKLLTDLLAEAQSTTPVPTVPKVSASNARTSIAASATSVLLLSPNSARTGCVISNESDANMRIGLASAVTMTSYDYPISAQTTSPGYFECPYGWTGAVYGIWASATGNARVAERTQ